MIVIMKFKLIFLAMVMMAISLSGCISEEQNDLATVTKIIDGDTVDVRIEDGSVIRVRLIGIDTPEIYGENTREKWPDIDLFVLNEIGMDAKHYLENTILEKRVSLIYDEQSGDLDKYGRYLYYISKDGTNISKELVKKGYARAYRKYDCNLKSELILLENEAIEQRMGLWAGEFSLLENRLYIEYIHYDAYGNDNSNIEDEYLILKNNTYENIWLDEWYICDLSGKKYIFDEITIGAQEELILSSGSGNGVEIYYWNSSRPIWNNDMDKASLYNNDGNLVDTYEYCSL